MLRTRLRALIFRHRAERDLDDEVQFHIAMQSRKLMASGIAESEALRRARIQFGGATQIKEECRDTAGVHLIQTIWQDARYAMRAFRRSPGFAATVVATIALGLGLNTALFTIFNAIYLRPVGVANPQSIYEPYWSDRTGHAHDYTAPQYQEFLAQNPAFSEAFAYRHTQARLDGRPILGTLVSPEYFRVLGIAAARGRTELPEESSIVLSYQTWQNRFAADPDIIGKTVRLRGYPLQIVGIASNGFAGLGSRPAEFWAPLATRSHFETEPDLGIVARLKDDYTPRQAQAALTGWTQLRFTDARQTTLLSRATTKPFNLKTALTFSPILAAFSLVLLLACANVANMLLARSLSRQREIAIRISLGAARARLIRQLLTESILLAVPSAIAGVMVSQATIALCVRVLLATLPPGASIFGTRSPQFPWDLRVFAFSLVFALLAAVLFGLAPALQVSKGDLSKASAPSRLLNSLVAAQVTVCVLLLITAGTLLRGVDRMHTLDTALSTRNTLQITVEPKSREAVLARLSLETVAAAESAPVERKPTLIVQPGLIPTAANHVSPEYFALFDIPILRGRNFSAVEARTLAPVAIVSETAARRLWPNQNPLGRSLMANEHAVTVIGIARDEMSRWIGSGEDMSLVYLPTNPHAAGTSLFLPFNRDLEAALDPQSVNEMHRLQVREWVSEDAYYTLRISYWLSSAIGILALLLTLSGIYGVISFVISQRTKEIGIRMALGATTAAVTALILRQSMKLAAYGALAGSILAMGVSRLLASTIVAIAPFDAVALFGGAVLVLAACAAAAYVPSRRVARIDPLITLRCD